MRKLYDNLYDCKSDKHEGKITEETVLLIEKKKSRKLAEPSGMLKE